MRTIQKINGITKYNLHSFLNKKVTEEIIKYNNSIEKEYWLVESITHYTLQLVKIKDNSYVKYITID